MVVKDDVERLVRGADGEVVVRGDVMCEVVRELEGRVQWLEASRDHEELKWGLRC